MSQNVPENQLPATEWAWSDKKLQAAAWLAEGERTDEQIAAEIKVTRRTLSRWKEAPEFERRIKEFTDETYRSLMRRGVANRNRRLNAYIDRYAKLERIISERAAHLAEDDAPGVTTGLVAKERKTIGSGFALEFIDVYTLDTPLLRELRELEKQAATEVGEWVNKQSHSFDLDGLTPEELQVVEKLSRKFA